MIFEENRFENILASLRVRKGWTQEDAVAHIRDIGKGISRRTYIDLETGKLPPSEKHLKLLATGFKLNQADTDALYHAAHHGSPQLHNLPFRRNPLFTGREDQLKHLAQLLKENYSVALSGLAGIGKTQLALEYAHRGYAAKVYQAVFWVSAADEESLLTGYAKLAEKLELPEKDEQEIYKIAEAVKEWLERHTNWLLIMDNADDLQLARSFFPGVNEDVDNPGHILLTTRSQFVGTIAGQIIEIDKMEPEEGLRFLLRRSKVLKDETKFDRVAADIRAAAMQVVKLLDGLPLALDQAGAYIEETKVSFADYVELYDKERLSLLKRRDAQQGKLSDHPESVVVTFELCFAKARERHPLAIDILCFCAYLHPDSIPDELFQHDNSFRYGTTVFYESIAALHGYSLMKRNAEERTLSLHRLVQAVLIETMPPNLEDLWIERVVRSLSVTFPNGEIEEWPQCERLLPHVLVYEAIITPEQDSLLEPGFLLDISVLFYKAGLYSYNRGRYLLAEVLLLRVHSIYERLIGGEHLKTLHVLLVLVDVFFSRGMYEPIEPLLVRVLSIQEKLLGTEHPDTVSTLYKLAMFLFAQEKLEQAKPLMEKLLSIQKEQLDEDHPEIAKTLMMLAVIHSTQGRSDLVELLYQRAIRIYEKWMGVEHPETANALGAIALLMQSLGQNEQADALYQRSLSILEKQLGSTHPRIHEIRKHYVAFLYSVGRNAEAAALEANDESSE